MIKQQIREKAFWLLDSIKGGKIKKHYGEISFINQGVNTKEVKNIREKNIHDLLCHATQTTDYYKKFSGFNSLNDFPVIEKTTVQDNFNKFFSNKFRNKKIFKVATSGSTGVPFFLYHNKNKKLRNTADTIYHLSQSNFKIGQKLYDIEVWRDINMNSPLKSWLQNLIYVDSTYFNDKEIEVFLTKLEKDTSDKSIMGFASAFESICKYLDKIESGPLHHINVSSIIAISEYLTDYVRNTMEKYFGVPIVSRYSNEELGIIAQQFPNTNNDEFHINWASYHVEVLKMNSDIPVEPNEMGRIVVTDLFNYCMPLIRYDTGDIACFTSELEKNNSYPNFKKIEGRKMDAVFNTKGELVSSFIVYTKFYDYYDLLIQYQFIQTGKQDYLIKLNTHSGQFNHKEKLIKSIKEDFGNDANVKLELVNEIPPLSSGKRKKVVNYFNNAS